MTELATFGAGCFWGVEAAFRKVAGVVNATAGFMGGTMENPTWFDVVYRKTGHVEVVQLEFGPSQISYSQLLQIFWLVHDPTQVNRQGNDVGDEYRTVIFYHSDEQQQLAERSKQQLEASGQYDQPLATTIEPATTFYPAGEEHQQYLAKHPGGYCHVNLGRVDEFLKLL
ncbi:peptide-methionine (S)-S-oxide reductase MsrA [Candidatus Berkelbacteria bacterium]|nr:peptide-methionine (S)-S-oxide reductase MsrA [Candidatus Berkelbacteria bacterium]